MSEGTGKTRYRLFAMRTEADTPRRLEEYRFGRVTPGYTLLYTDGEGPEKSVEVAGEDLRRLSAADENWLADCNVALLFEKTAENEGAFSARMEKMIQRFSEELEKEAAGHGTE